MIGFCSTLNIVFDFPGSPIKGLWRWLLNTKKTVVGGRLLCKTPLAHQKLAQLKIVAETIYAGTVAGEMGM